MGLWGPGPVVVLCVRTRMCARVCVCVRACVRVCVDSALPLCCACSSRFDNVCVCVCVCDEFVSVTSVVPSLFVFCPH